MTTWPAVNAPSGCQYKLVRSNLICAPENNVPTRSSLLLSGYTAITCDAATTPTPALPDRDDPVEDPYSKHDRPGYKCSSAWASMLLPVMVSWCSRE